MIIRPEGDGALLITQADHAALSARIMKAWQRDHFSMSGRRADILLAIEEHDNGWRDTDTWPLRDPATGALLDFITAPDAVRRAVWPRGISCLAGTPYAAALVAQHALHIYRRYHDEAEWDEFFAEMERAREHHLGAAGIRGVGDLRRDYLFLRVADLASLAFCCGWTDHQLDDSGSGYSVHLEGTHLRINPDPFEGQILSLEVTARRLPARTFAGDDEARQAWSAAAPEKLRGTASGR